MFSIIQPDVAGFLFFSFFHLQCRSILAGAGVRLPRILYSLSFNGGFREKEMWGGGGILDGDGDMEGERLQL
jgi:hypothetical protein